MRKNLFSTIAVLLGITLSAIAITKKDNRFAALYLIYQSGAQTVPGNYATQASQPSTCNFAGWLCWIKINDANNNGIAEQAELNAFFTTYDTDHDGSLNDESEVTGTLEKKFFGERKERTGK